MDKFKKLMINKDAKEHLYLQVFRVLKQAILNGDLVSGDKLPPIRELAALLRVNNSTVVQAYRSLEQEGLVIKKIGSGTYVFTEREEERLQFAYGEGQGRHSIVQRPSQEDAMRINFASGTPNDAYFPVEDFKALINEVLDRDGSKAFSYEDAQGYAPLRESLAQWCFEKQIPCHADDVQVISGAQQGLDIVIKALLGHQDTVLVEAPTYTGALALLKSKGVKIVEVPIEGGKVNFLKFKELVINHRPKLFFTMTNLQNPTGFSYTDDEKRQILELAKRYGFIIVEDDYASELCYSGKVLKSLKSMDQAAQVVYIKSFSKVVLPGLRLGFMLVPEYLRERMTAVKHQTDISTSSLIQRSFDLYIRKGYLEAHTYRVASVYQEKFKCLKDAVEAYFPAIVHCWNPEGGANLWCEMPEGKSARELYTLAKSRGILIASGDVFFASKLDTQAFRLSISATDSQEIAVGVRLLAQVLEDFLK